MLAWAASVGSKYHSSTYITSSLLFEASLEFQSADFEKRLRDVVDEFAQIRW